MTAVGFKIRLRKNNEYFIRVEFATQRERYKERYDLQRQLSDKQAMFQKSESGRERAGEQKRDRKTEREGSCLTDKLLFKI
jgi:hypothetical protein